MPRMNRTGPESKGPKTGRGLGKCNEVPKDERELKLGKGLGKRRKSSESSGVGCGKRFRYNT